ncbi:MAG: class I SAM-dependent methyltransferase [Anaeroplasmataceae bacterium]|nr:class I SAM-dependent methyltransferase [Anaeroplasmataceae bacterium]
MKCCCKAPLKELCIQKTRVKLCSKCGLLTKIERISFEEERNRYDEHQCDEGYQSYMENVYNRIKGYLKEGISLDYGCGQIHLLADYLNKNHFSCDYYDLHYFPLYPKRTYDTILLIEVFEHLYEPYQELIRLRGLLNESGRIIIITKTYDDVDLENWWYFRDKTHISFLKKNTFSFWNIGMKIIAYNEDIFVLERI